MSALYVQSSTSFALRELVLKVAMARSPTTGMNPIAVDIVLFIIIF